MATIFTVDAMNLAHAAAHTTVLSAGDIQTHVVYGVLRSLKAALNRKPGSQVFVLWDGRAQFRFDIYPDYKGNREVATTPEELAADKQWMRQLSLLKFALPFLGVRQLRNADLEADDMNANLVPKLVAAGHTVEMITGDKDWLQYVCPQVSWYDPIRDRRCTHLNFSEFTGMLTIEGFVDFKAVVGDTSDFVPGIGGLGKDRAPGIINQYGSYLAFVDAFHRGETEKTKGGKPKALDAKACSPEAVANYHRNIKLMDLRKAPAPDPAKTTVVPGDYDEAKFRAFCHKLAFQSILREFDGFMSYFSHNRPLLAAA